MEARLADEEEAVVFEPGEHALRQSAHLVVSQVHQQPVGEDDVVFVLRSPTTTKKRNTRANCTRRTFFFTMHRNKIWKHWYSRVDYS